MDGHAEATQTNFQATFKYAEEQVEGEGAIGKGAEERENRVHGNEEIVKKLRAVERGGVGRRAVLSTSQSLVWASKHWHRSLHKPGSTLPV